MSLFFTKYFPRVTQEVVKMTLVGLARDENFIRMTTFIFQWRPFFRSQKDGLIATPAACNGLSQCHYISSELTGYFSLGWLINERIHNHWWPSHFFHNHGWFCVKHGRCWRPSAIKSENGEDTAQCYGSAEGPPRGVENRNLLSHPDDLRMEAYVIRMT